MSEVDYGKGGSLSVIWEFRKSWKVELQRSLSVYKKL
jgi:hypothetical protein